jgi:CubicO group peptidase (beta-lactamase class C family)
VTGRHYLQRRALGAALTCLGLLCGATSSMAEQVQAWAPDRLDTLHTFMRDATGRDGYLGGVTLIVHEGKVVDAGAYGFEDLARTRPMRRDAIFRIYSMTKTVTSVAVMMLVEEGKVSLDTAVADLLPGFEHPQVMTGGTAGAPVLRPASRRVTLHDLLTHTSGYPAGLDGEREAVRLMERVDPHGATDLADFAERMSRVPLAADPATRFGYDGASLELVARIVEVVSKKPFATFLQERIFTPLGMRDTGFSVPSDRRGRVVDITRTNDAGRLAIADGPSAAHPGESLNRYTSGAGGLYSTADDYARFAQMLLDQGRHGDRVLLGRKTVESMMRNHLGMLDPPVTQFSEGEGFGIGGYVVIDPARRGQLGSVGQYGWAGAASTTYTVDPHEHLVAILMLQHIPRDDGRKDLPRLARPFYDLVYHALP